MTNLSSYQQTDFNTKYGENPKEYQLYLAKLKEGSKPLTKEENNKREQQRREQEIKQQKEKEEHKMKMQEWRQKGMNNGEIHKTSVYEPAKKLLAPKINISEIELENPGIFIPKFDKYITEHNKNSNLNSKIKDMYKYTKIWKIQKEFDNLKSGEDFIPQPIMKPIWKFQEKYERYND